jgi:hypothetical protein
MMGLSFNRILAFSKNFSKSQGQEHRILPTWVAVTMAAFWYCWDSEDKTSADGTVAVLWRPRRSWTQDPAWLCSQFSSPNLSRRVSICFFVSRCSVESSVHKTNNHFTTPNVVRYIADSKGFRRWCITYRITRIWTVLIYQYSKNYKIPCFRKWICFLSQAGGRHLLEWMWLRLALSKGPNRADVFLFPSPVDNNSSSFQNVAFYSLHNIGWWTKTYNPMTMNAYEAGLDWPLHCNFVLHNTKACW